MKKLLYAVFMTAFSFLTLSCNDNLFTDISDKKSNEALQDEIRFAFINGDCQKVADLLAFKVNSFNTTESYQYSSALLCLTGMNLPNIFDNIFNSSVAIDPFSMIQSFMGVSEVNSSNLAYLKNNYSEVLSVCNNLGTAADDNMKTICGLTAASDTLLTVSELTMSVTGQSSVELSSTGIKSALTSNGKSEADLVMELNSKSQEEQDALLGSLSNNLNLVSGTATVIDKLTEGSGNAGQQFNDFTDSLKDNSTGLITNESLAEYLFGL